MLIHVVQILLIHLLKFMVLTSKTYLICRYMMQLTGNYENINDVIQVFFDIFLNGNKRWLSEKREYVFGVYHDVYSPPQPVVITISKTIPKPKFKQGTAEYSQMIWSSSKKIGKKTFSF